MNTRLNHFQLAVVFRLHQVLDQAFHDEEFMLKGAHLSCIVLPLKRLAIILSAATADFNGFVFVHLK